MNRRIAICVLYVGILGIAGGQPPPTDVPPPIPTATPNLPVPPGPVAEPIPSIPGVSVAVDQVATLPRIETPAQPAAPVPPTFDVLVQELQAVRAQKVELEKREKAITEALLKKFAEQKRQLEELGVVKGLLPLTPVPKLDDAPVPPVVPRDEKKGPVK